MFGSLWARLLKIRSKAHNRAKKNRSVWITELLLSATCIHKLTVAVKFTPNLSTTELNTKQMMKCLVKQTQLHAFCCAPLISASSIGEICKEAFFLSLTVHPGVQTPSGKQRHAKYCPPWQLYLAGESIWNESTRPGPLWLLERMAGREWRGNLWPLLKRDNMQLKERIKSNSKGKGFCL